MNMYFQFFFQFKIKMPYSLCSIVFSKFLCGRCNTNYYGERFWHLSVSVVKNLGVLLLIGKNSKSKKSTAVKDHMLSCDNIISIDDFKILATSVSDLHVKVKECLLIHQNATSLPLYLFNWSLPYEIIF